MISIIIPAHNEAAVIGRCLRALTEAGATGGGGEVEVIVVANGCTDETAAIARKFGAPVRVIETPVPSKASALNLGDAAAEAAEGGAGRTRFYLDADVVLSAAAIKKVAAVLAAEGPALAAAPLMRLDTADRPWAVRAYYRVWQRLPYCRSGMIGSGVYALSAAGRRRFARFPAITADDAFVRLHFKPHERVTVSDCTFTVTPPKTLERIVHIKTRSHFGNEELRRAYPHLWDNEEARHGGALLRLAANPLWWPALAVYGYVKFAVRRRTRRRFANNQIDQWERDESSRQPAAAGNT